MKPIEIKAPSGLQTVILYGEYGVTYGRRSHPDEPFLWSTVHDRDTAREVLCVLMGASPKQKRRLRRRQGCIMVLAMKWAVDAHWTMINKIVDQVFRGVA